MHNATNSRTETPPSWRAKGLNFTEPWLSVQSVRGGAHETPLTEEDLTLCIGKVLENVRSPLNYEYGYEANANFEIPVTGMPLLL